GGDRRGPTAAASCAPRSPSRTPAGRQLGCAQREELGPYSVCVMAAGTAVEQVFVPKGRGGLSPSFSLVAALTRWRQCLGEGHPWRHSFRNAWRWRARPAGWLE